MNWMFDPERARDADARSFFTAALIGCCLLVVSMAVITTVSDRRNHAAAEVETAALRDALTREVRDIGTRLQAYAALTPLNAPVGGLSAVHGPFQQLYVFDPSSPGFAGAVAQSPVHAAFHALLGPATPQGGELRGAIGVDNDLIAPGALRSAVLSIGGAPVMAVAAGTPPVAQGTDRPSADLIAVEPIGPAVLARVARQAGTMPLTITSESTRSEGTSALTIGSEGLALTWRPDRPGDSFFRTGSGMIAWAGALFAAFILFRSRRLTQELSASEARAKADAAHDLLTGLPNRTSFQSFLATEIEHVNAGEQRGFAVLYMDIDRFKEINDTYGHQAGDQVIVTTAQRIVGAVRNAGKVARIGGDEFAILLTRVSGPVDTATLARRILDAFADPVDIGSTEASIGVSIGIALFPLDAQTADAITSSADLALYRSKNEGRNRFCFFEARMGEELRMRRTVEEELRRAIAEDQLVMEFQPVVSLDGNEILGVEALVRWRHPTQGTISPASFITLAEDCGLILQLGEWVLRKALLEVRRWPQLRVAVNVSAVQFRQKQFVGIVQRLLTETGVEPRQLELELTESVLLADADQAEDAMIELRAMGVRLALDDFGTGYSSLIYLRRFAFDKIKIDRSFLEWTEATGESAIIVHSIVHLGRALGLTVTAEGVETPDQHRFMQALGCHELQGYLFSPPVSADKIDAMLPEGPHLRSVA